VAVKRNRKRKNVARILLIKPNMVWQLSDEKWRWFKNAQGKVRVAPVEPAFGCLVA